MNKFLCIIKFLSIFAYTILIFFFSGYALLAFCAVNIAAMAVTKVTPVSALRYLTGLLPFILFACVFNFVLGYAADALYLGIRLILICNITQCYKKAVSTTELANAIEILFSPLRIFKIEGRDIGLMVCIGLAFLPVLRRDFSAIRAALRSKGMKLTSRSLKYLLKPFFIGILRRTDEISRSIRAKAYE